MTLYFPLYLPMLTWSVHRISRSSLSLLTGFRNSCQGRAKTENIPRFCLHLSQGVFLPCLGPLCSLLSCHWHTSGSLLQLSHLLTSLFSFFLTSGNFLFFKIPFLLIYWEFIILSTILFLYISFQYHKHPRQPFSSHQCLKSPFQPLPLPPKYKLNSIDTTSSSSGYLFLSACHFRNLVTNWLATLSLPQTICLTMPPRVQCTPFHFGYYRLFLALPLAWIVIEGPH